MSRRTAEADKAIREAWKKERELVLSGEGTRDWTPEQQISIIEKGKVYDEDENAYEGHHMKSVVAYPEFQGDANNIQFLSRFEHKNAHGGKFSNSTNGYYDPITHITTPFQKDSLIPCKIIKLSNPIEKTKIIAQEKTRNDESLSYKDENKQNENNELIDDSSSQNENIPILQEVKSNNQKECITESTNSEEKNPLQNIEHANFSLPNHPCTQPIQRKGFFSTVWGGVKSGANLIKEFIIANKEEIIAGATAIGLGVAAEVLSQKRNSSTSSTIDCQSGTSNFSSYSYNPTVKENGQITPASLIDDIGNDIPGTPKSPHLRRGHITHVWTNNGREERWIDDIQVNKKRSNNDSE